MAEKRLYRSRTNKMIGGVAAGVADYFAIDPTLVRLIFVVVAIALNGIGVALYIAAMVIIPEEPLTAKEAKEINEAKEEQKTKAVAHDLTKNGDDPQRTQTTRQVWGFILIGLGLIFLLERFISVNIWKTYWPLILIVIGLAIILRKTDRKE